MRITLEIMLVFVSLMVLVLGFEGAERLTHERAVAEDDLAREQELLGRALRPSVVDALGEGGVDAARAFLRDAEADEATVALALERERDRDEAEHASTRFRREGEGRVETRVPVASADGRRYALVLTQSLEEVTKAVRGSAARVAITAVAILIGTGIFAVVLGDRLVGRRVRAMVSETRRIAAGESGPRVLAAGGVRRDELGALEQAIVEMSHGLDEARARASSELEARLDADRRWFHGARLAAVGTLAAGVAHELGTPLQVVSGRARMIFEGDGVPEKHRRHAEIIRDQSASMERTVRAMLRLARAEPALDVDVELGEMVQDTLESLHPLASAASCRLRLGASERVVVRGDPAHLRHLVVNLVQNALQAVQGARTSRADAGDVEVRVYAMASEEVSIPRGVRASERAWACIEVRDDGPGIPTPLESRVFDPFFTTKDVGEGTGMGLSVADGIAREHGGWIELVVDRDDGAAGATFRVYLPQREEAS